VEAVAWLALPSDRRVNDFSAEGKLVLTSFSLDAFISIALAVKG
jgi:hypothetical protein